MTDINTPQNNTVRRIVVITAAAAAAVIALCITALYRFGIINPNFYSDDRLIELNSGWTVSDSNGRIIAENVSLPCKYGIEGEYITLYRPLPDADTRIDALIFNNNRESMSVSLNGRELYSVNRSGLSRYISATGLNTVKLSYRRNALLSVNVYAGNKRNCSIGSVLGGSTGSIDGYILRYDLVTFICIIVLAAISISLFFSYIYLRIRRMTDRRIALLFVFALIMMLWAFFDSSLVDLMPVSLEAAALISYTLYTFIPVPVILYTCFVRRDSCTSLSRLLAAGFAVTAMRILLAALGFARLDETLPAGMLYIMVSIIFCIYYMYGSPKHASDHLRRLLFNGYALTLICAFISLILYMSGSSALYRSVAITAVTALYIELSVVSVFSNASVIKRFNDESQRRRELENEAHTDSLTGLGNRHAFDDALQLIEQDPEQYSNAVLVMLDLNGLKYANDTYGHNAGDELITSAARCIHETIGSGCSCFRIGGDEFTVILNNAPGSVSIRLAKMHMWIEKHNLTARYKLSIAHGESPLKYPGGGFKSISDWKQDADINMYNNKSLSSLRRSANPSKEYQNILRCIINGAGDIDKCRSEIEEGLGTIYDAEVGQRVLDNWDSITNILVPKPKH